MLTMDIYLYIIEDSTPSHEYFEKESKHIFLEVRYFFFHEHLSQKLKMLGRGT